jgi:hypothetical protein
VVFVFQRSRNHVADRRHLVVSGNRDERRYLPRPSAGLELRDRLDSIARLLERYPRCLVIDALHWIGMEHDTRKAKRARGRCQPLAIVLGLGRRRELDTMNAGCVDEIERL